MGEAAIPEKNAFPETDGHHIEISFIHSLPDPSRIPLSWISTGMSRQEYGGQAIFHGTVSSFYKIILYLLYVVNK